MNNYNNVQAENIVQMYLWIMKLNICTHRDEKN